MGAPGSLRIGPVEITPATLLAPMEAITDGPFRALIRSLGGCGLVVTEFISARQLSQQQSRALQLAELAHDSHPVSVQIYGRDPDEMAESARLCEELGADLVDINMGCPSKAVTSGCAGSALMREPRLAQRIVEAVRTAIRVPLTVKMRLGWDERNKNASTLARAFEDLGVNAVTVHGRTRADLYRGRADWDAIGQVKAAVGIPIIGNGDICSVADALRMYRQAGVDGIMVGRGVLKNPWLLLQISQAVSGVPVTHPTLAQRRQHLLDYFALIARQRPHERAILGKMKKVTGLFTEGLGYASDLRDEVLHAPTIPEAIGAVHRFFDRLERLEQEEGRDPFQNQAIHGTGSRVTD